jgi:DNA-binding CsgD family transcriptional regulator
MMHCLLISSRSLFSPLLAGLLAQLCAVEMAVCEPVLEESLAMIDRHRPRFLLLDLDRDQPCLCRQLATRLLQWRPEARLICLQAQRCCHLDSTIPVGGCPGPAGHEALVAPPLGGWNWLQLVELITRLAAHHGRAAADRALPPPQRLQGLAPRERMVLHQLGDGLTSREIAAELGITLQTAETYRKNLASKLGVSGSQLVRLAVLCRCTDPQPPLTGAGGDQPAAAGALAARTVGLGVGLGRRTA